MSGFSVHLDNAILSAIFKGDTLSVPSTHIALFSSEAGLEENLPSAQLEITGSGYSRIQMYQSDFSDPDNSLITNISTIRFNEALEDWSAISHMAIMDDNAVGTGNVLVWGELTNPITGEAQPRQVFQGDQLILRVNALVVELLNYVEQITPTP